MVEGQSASSARQRPVRLAELWIGAGWLILAGLARRP